MKLTQKGNIYIWILVAVVILAAAAWYFYKARLATIPSAVKPLSVNDTTTAIQNDLNAVDLGSDLKSNLDKELDADINSLK